MKAVSVALDFDIGSEDSVLFGVKEDSAVVDITGYTITCAVRENFKAPVVKTFATGTGEIVLSTPTNGEFTLNMSEADSALFSAGDYYYDIWLDDGAGTQSMWVRGVMSFYDRATSL